MINKLPDAPASAPIGMEWSGILWRATRVVGCVRHKVEAEVTIYQDKIADRGDWFRPTCKECLREEREEEDRKQREAQRREHIQGCIDKAGIPPRFQSATLDTYNATSPKQRAALGKMCQFRDTFSSGCRVGRSLLITGRVGTGKTHLATSLVSELAAQGFSARYIQANDMLRMIKATWDRNSEVSEERVIKRLVEIDLLVLDEVGTGHGSETEMRYLSEVLDWRYRDYKSTAIVTNLDEKALIEVLGPRAHDRLLETGNVVVVCDWDSYRRTADIGLARGNYVPPPPPLSSAEKRHCQLMEIEYRLRSPNDVRTDIARWRAELDAERERAKTASTVQ